MYIMRNSTTGVCVGTFNTVDEAESWRKTKRNPDAWYLVTLIEP